MIGDDPLGIGHLAVRTAHHAMLAGDRVLILTLGGLASAPRYSPCSCLIIPIHNRNPVAVAFLGHARARHEAQGGGIHAVAQAAAVGRAVGEHVAQVNLCVRRAHFDAVAARNAVVLMLGQQVTGNRAGERGPAAAGIELSRDENSGSPLTMST